MRAARLLLVFSLVLPLLGQSELEKAVEEFKIQTRELGLRGDSAPQRRAAARNARWRGRLYENVRNDYFDAIPHQVKQRGGTKPPLRRHQFGVNLTGPLVIPRIYHGGNRTFLSFSYEGVRDRQSRSYLQTIATTPERSGDFSATVDQAGRLLPVFDPSTTRANPAFDPSRPISLENLEYLRDTFPGNWIPPARLDPVAQSALEFYPEPNAAVGPFFRNNYFLISPQTNDADGVIVRVDHSIRQRHRFNVNFSYSNGLNGYAALLPTPANPASPDRHFRDPSGSLHWVFTRSSQTVVSLRFYADSSLYSTGEEGEPDYAGQMGLRGSSPLAFPSFNITGYTSMGRPYPRTKSTYTSYRWTGGLSHNRGKHSFSVSSSARVNQVNTFQTPYPAGSFRFSEGLTSLPGIVGTGHGFASFLLGLASYAEKSYTVSPSYFRMRFGSLSLREEYRAQPGLTLSFSLELNYRTPRFEKYDRQSTVDLSVINPVNGRPGAMIVAGSPGVGRAFQPHLLYVDAGAGLNWNLFGDTRSVMRLGYDSDHSAPGIYATDWGTQAFNARPIYLSANPQLSPALVLRDGLPPLDRPLPDTRPEAVNDTNADLIYRGDVLPVQQSVSASAERQLPFSTVVSVGASASWGKDIYGGNAVVNLNALPLSALAYRDDLYNEAFNRSLRPFPHYRSLNVGGIYPAGRYRRESWYVSAEKRASGGLSLGVSLSWVKARDDYSGGRQDFFNRRNEWSLASINPFRINVNYMYELPFGRGKALFAYADWRKHIFDGWALSGSSFYASGEPLALYPQFNNTGGVISFLRVNAVPGVDPGVPNPGPALWFNPAAFDQPPNFTLGNVSRRHPSLRNPPYQNHDVSFSKRFAVSADRTLEFSALALNFPNHANWNDPDTVIGPASAPNVNAGKIIGSTGGRVMQLGLKYSF
jgi:hypothetical protein